MKGDFAVKVLVISLAGITCDHGTEMLELTIYLIKYLIISNTLKVVFKYFQIQLSDDLLCITSDWFVP